MPVPLTRKWTSPGLLLLIGVGALLNAGPAAAQQNSNEGGMLLRQCEAMLSGTAEIAARMTCENTIWSTLRAVERIKQENSSMKLGYCAPEQISVTQAAKLYVGYVNAHPETLHMPAEHALILALESTYPCPG